MTEEHQRDNWCEPDYWFECTVSNCAFKAPDYWSKWEENDLQAGMGLWCIPLVQLFTRDLHFFLSYFIHHQDLNTAAELTQQKFIYSLCCDFQAADRDSWPLDKSGPLREHGCWTLLKCMQISCSCSCGVVVRVTQPNQVRCRIPVCERRNGLFSSTLSLDPKCN